MNLPNSGIYCITNTINNKKYIGQSINLKARFRRHKASRLHEVNSKSCRAIQLAFKKYGIENFKFEVLVYCDDRVVLNLLESRIIDFCNTMVPKGYNLNAGGDYKAPCEETRAKLKNRIPWNKGMKFVLTEEEKQRRRDNMIRLNKSRKGIPRTEEQKRLQSEKMKGKPGSRKGVAVSEESRKKMSDAKKGRFLSHLWTPEVIEKRNASRYGSINNKQNKQD